MLSDVKLNYTFESEDDNEIINYDYKVNISLRDIVEFKFQQKYGKPFAITNYYLEDGAKEFVKSIENDYMLNKIDVYELSKSSEMYDFLKEKYWAEAHWEYVGNQSYSCL